LGTKLLLGNEKRKHAIRSVYFNISYIQLTSHCMHVLLGLNF